MLEFKQVQLKIVENEKALYSFAELKEYIDWEVRRVYFVQNCKSATGQHCHFDEEEMFILAKGSATAIIDYGEGKKVMMLSSPGDAVVVGKKVWHGFKDFSEDALLLALSSTNYRADRSDYCEDYEEYLNNVRDI